MKGRPQAEPKRSITSNHANDDTESNKKYSMNMLIKEENPEKRQRRVAEYKQNLGVSGSMWQEYFYRTSSWINLRWFRKEKGRLSKRFSLTKMTSERQIFKLLSSIHNVKV